MYIFLFLSLFIFRDRERENRGGQGEKERERISSRFQAISTELHAGLEAMNHEIMTRAKIKS